jgi:hypothetical protein
LNCFQRGNIGVCHGQPLEEVSEVADDAVFV